MPETSAMMLTEPGPAAELLGIAVAALLTVAVLSYVIGNNAVYRWVQYLFVGMAAGYASVMAWHHVLWPRLHLLLTQPGTYWYYGLFFALGVLLLARGVRPISGWANLPLAVMVGTGSGLALGGVLTGTLLPQLQATIVSLNPSHHAEGVLGWLLAIDALLAMLITICVLCAFHYTAAGQGMLGKLANRLVSGMGSLGRRLIVLGMGVLLAGALMAFFALLSSRIDMLIQSWQRISSLVGF